MNLKIGCQALMFTLVALWLGEVKDFYEKYWWFDLLLHTVAGILTSYWIFRLFEQKDKPVKVLFVLSLTTNLLVGWEVFEYLADTHLDLNMQKDGIKDTMEDLIVGKLGAAVGFIYYEICLSSRDGFHN